MSEKTTLIVETCADSGVVLWGDKLRGQWKATVPKQYADVVKAAIERFDAGEETLPPGSAASVSATPAIQMRELCYLYWSAYHAGHHDTVEGSYTDVLPVDRFDYWQDRVQECLQGGDMPTTLAVLEEMRDQIVARNERIAALEAELNTIHALAMNPQDTAPREGDKYTVALLRQLLATNTVNALEPQSNGKD